MAQRTFMLLKIAAISIIVLCGIAVLVQGRQDAGVVAAGAGSGAALGAGAARLAGGDGIGALLAALTPVMFAYGGWQTASFVAAELKNPERDLSRAMIYGLLGVVTLYLAVNVVCLLVLGAPGLAATKTPAATVVDKITGGAGATILSAFVAISTFGFLTQSLFTVPRLYQVMAADGLFFRRVAHVSPRRHVPTVAIVLQGTFCAVIAAAGTYEAIMSYVIAVDFLFYGLAALALLVFYARRAVTPQYRVPGGRWTTALFMLGCWGVVAATVVHDPSHALVGLAALTVGLPGYFIWRRMVARERLRGAERALPGTM
jgi:APA family basic amino acid/polyamine antiporter